MVYWIYKQNRYRHKEAARTAGTMLAQAPNPNPKETRAATRLQTYRAVLGPEPHVHALWPSSTKGHGVGGTCRAGWQGALGLALGKTLWFRDKVLTDAQRLRLHTHRACVFHWQMLSC